MKTNQLIVIPVPYLTNHGAVYRDSGKTKKKKCYIADFPSSRKKLKFLMYISITFCGLYVLLNTDTNQMDLLKIWPIVKKSTILIQSS